MANNHQNSNHNYKPQDIFADGPHHHVMPVGILYKVAGALIGLTVLTVVCARIHLGALAVPIAFGIALTKAYLVMSYFMGLKFDTKLNRIIFASGFAFLLLLYIISVTDIFTRVLHTNPL